jgi:hypothetical protein
VANAEHGDEAATHGFMPTIFEPLDDGATYLM